MKRRIFFSNIKRILSFFLFSYFGFCVFEKLILSQISKTKNKFDNNSDLLYHTVVYLSRETTYSHIISYHKQAFGFNFRLFLNYFLS
jgi:hypothetical protein